MQIQSLPSPSPQSGSQEVSGSDRWRSGGGEFVEFLRFLQNVHPLRLLDVGHTLRRRIRIDKKRAIRPAARYTHCVDIVVVSVGGTLSASGMKVVIVIVVKGHRRRRNALRLFIENLLKIPGPNLDLIQSDRAINLRHEFEREILSVIHSADIPAVRMQRHFVLCLNLLVMGIRIELKPTSSTLTQSAHN